MFYVKNMHLFGHLCGAEQAAPPRAKRDVNIIIGAPFGMHTIQRSLIPLKYYHDFDCDWNLCSYAFGPCWEPVNSYLLFPFASPQFELNSHFLYLSNFTFR